MRGKGRKIDKLHFSPPYTYFGLNLKAGLSLRCYHCRLLIALFTKAKGCSIRRVNLAFQCSVFIITQLRNYVKSKKASYPQFNFLANLSYFLGFQYLTKQKLLFFLFFDKLIIVFNFKNMSHKDLSFTDIVYFLEDGVPIIWGEFNNYHGGKCWRRLDSNLQYEFRQLVKKYNISVDKYGNY